MSKNYNKEEWNKRWEKDFLIAKSFIEYRNQMGSIVKDYLDLLNLNINELMIRNKKVLDIGGGYGPIIKFLIHDSNEKTLVDISEKGIEIANNYYKLDNAYSIDILTEDIPGNPKFDIILLNEVIEHIHPSELDHLAKVLFSLLTPKGKVIVTTPNLASFSSRIFLMLGKLPQTFRLDQTHISVFTPKVLNKLFISNSFKKVKVVTTNIRFTLINKTLPLNFGLGEHILGIWEK